MKTIDKEQALAALTQVVEERGGFYVYTPPLGGRCVYADDGTPSCGVGLALSILGVSTPVLEQLDAALGGSEICGGPVEKILLEEGFTLTLGAVDVFAKFQQLQDKANPYEFALAESALV